jgi:uncharacterized protein (DUF58 family)
LKFWNNIYLNGVFFILLGLVATLFAFGHFYPTYYTAASILLVIIAFAFVLDFVLLYSKKGISGERKIGSILSNGDKNPCSILINNAHQFQLTAKIYEEIPHQLGLRELTFNTKLPPSKTKTIEYIIEPKLRGEYDFGDTIVLIKTPLRLVQRRYQISTHCQVAVYPSYIHLNKYNLQNFKYYTSDVGSKKIRKIGHSTEFEQIKGYVKGDDIRHVNWKASAKMNSLMVNQYTEEKAQQIFCVIDTGRAMQMPFNGLSLLDYAINSSLAMSHVIVKNNDRVGLTYFNKRVDKILPPNKNISQIQKILNLLYNLKTEFYESNFEKLYSELKFRVNHRSLLLMFTNFEDMNSLKRQLPYLIGMAKTHVLVVIFFKNSEVDDIINNPAKEESDYYDKAVAEKQSFQKRLMVKELSSHGIQTLLTDPKSLTIDTINKYLEIKSKGIL